MNLLSNTSTQPEYKYHTTKKKVSPFMLILIGGIIYRLFLRDRLGSPVTFINLDLMFIFLVLSYFAIRGWIDREKYNSFQLLYPAGHTSLGVEPYEFNEVSNDAHVPFLIFRKDGYAGENLPRHYGNNGVYVIPKMFCKSFSGNFVATATPEEVELRRLPQHAQNYIHTHALNPPYYFCGRASHDAPSVAQKDMNSFYDLYLAQNLVISRAKEVLGDKFDIIDVFNEKSVNVSQGHNKTPKN